MSATEIPGYKIIRTLGVGGQATVYLAIQQGFDREVALKVMSPALAADPTFGERFIREAKIVAKLSHKSIVTVYDVGESGNFYYLAMEYLPGGDLKNRIAEGVKTRECLSIIGKLAIALNFAHEKGYIHRDVKSENILFNEDGEPVLTDFGIAKASNSSTQMTQTGKLIGTPEYMSPEQCRGKKIDGRSDLYSLGVILFEMLTRQVPFTGEDSVAVCIKHVTKPLPELPARLKHIQWLIDSLMAKDPEKRFQSGKELARAVLDFSKTGQEQNVPKSKTAAPKQMRKSTDTDAFKALDEEPDTFDELHTEKRYQITELEEKSPLAKVVVIMLLVIAGAAGYFTQDKWFPQTQKWVNETILGKSPQQSPGVNTPQERLLSDSRSDAKNKGDDTSQKTTSTSAPTSAELLQEADALVQFVPQKLDDIKKALKLVATVKTLEPDNKNAQLIYQNILSTSLMEATAEAEKNNFELANNWLVLVEYEEPSYSLLEATKTRVTQLKQAFDSQQQTQQQAGQQLTQLLASGEKALADNRLSSPPNDNAINYFESALKLDPQNVQAQQGLVKVAAAYEILIDQAVQENSYSKAKAFLSRFNNLSDDQAKKLALRQKIANGEKRHNTELEKRKQQAAQKEKQRQEEAARMARLNDPMVQMRLLGSLDSAKSLESAGSLVMPEGNNALEKYRSVLEMDDRNDEAKNGIARIEKAIIDNLTSAIAAADRGEANNWLTQLKLFDDNHPQFESFKTAIDEIIEPLPATGVDSDDSALPGSQPDQTQTEPLDSQNAAQTPTIDLAPAVEEKAVEKPVSDSAETQAQTDKPVATEQTDNNASANSEEGEPDPETSSTL